MSVSTRNSSKRKRKTPNASAKSSAPAASATQPQGFAQRYLHSTMALGLTSAVALFLSFPPVGLWPLAWLAPFGWLWLIRVPELPATNRGKSKAEKGTRRQRCVRFWSRPYPTIWLSGFVFWMAVLHWLRLPHWATSAGWVALCFYFAFYIPLFVGLSRVLVHRLKVSIVLAAPIVWTAMEFIRAYMLTGFSMAELGHSQHHWNWLIQIADLGGSFIVSFVVMFAAACLARMLPLRAVKAEESKSKLTWWPLISAAVLIGIVVGYGAWRTGQPSASPERSIRVALIQSAFDTEFRVIEGRDDAIMAKYRQLTEQAIAASDEPVDLVVWPESMFRIPFHSAAQNAMVPPGWDPETMHDEVQARQSIFEQQVEAHRQQFGVPAFLAGHPREHLTKAGSLRFNSAVFMAQPSADAATDANYQIYDKMHAVPFGEYMPLARYMPWIYNIVPFSGIEEGAEPKLFEVSGMTFAPSICFESIQSHHIRDAVVDLRHSHGEPDLLINVTNDGWFWGSSELDLHLICGQFRAIENRKPFLIAANTGISAAIDGNGQVLERGPKRGDATIVRTVSPDPRQSHYLDYGPWFAWLCLATTALAAVVGFRGRWQARGSA